MINFIRKIFIKDYQNINDEKVREKHGTVASIGGIITNIILVILKITIGAITFSMSIISDGINNLTDLISCIVSLIGFKIASKPADEKHPYGHERIEYVAGLIISFIIIVIGVALGYSAINELIRHEVQQSFEYYIFIILGISILLKILLGLFYKGIGKAIDSVSLKASKQDSFNDAICTSAVLICTLVQMFFPNLWWIDASASLAISLFICYSGIKLVFETASPLIGLSPDSTFVKTLVKDILSYDGVLGIHDVVCHSYGPTRKFATIHVEVDGYVNAMELHDLIDNIEEDMSKKYNIELTIHMDPIDTKNREIPILKDAILNILKNIDANLNFHDLRLVAGPTHTNVVFDVVMPIKAKYTKEFVLEKLNSGIKNIDKKYNLVVKIDNSYCN